MKPLHIDFAPHTIRRAVQQTPFLAWLAGSAGLLLCIAAAVSGFDLTRQYDTLQDELLRVNAQLSRPAKLQAASTHTTISEAQANAINNAIIQLNLPWGDVLDAIENATPPSIALLNIEPDARKKTVKGLAEAKDSDAMIAYIESLKQQVFFGTVILTKHETNEQDSNRPIRFQFEAQWAEYMSNQEGEE